MPDHQPGLTRRAFLRRGGMAASLALLARLPAAPAAAALGAAPAEGRFLSPREREILAHVVRRMIHPAGDAPGSGEAAVSTIEALLGRLDRSVVADLPLAIHLFEWGPMIFDLTFTRFTRMSDARKDASIRCWMTSRLALRRLAFLAVRNLAFIGHYAQPASWDAIGYKGPLLAPGAGP